MSTDAIEEFTQEQAIPEITLSDKEKVDYLRSSFINMRQSAIFQDQNFTDLVNEECFENPDEEAIGDFIASLTLQEEETAIIPKEVAVPPPSFKIGRAHV